MRWSPQQVADAWQRYSTRIPVSFAVGTVTRESGFDPLCRTPEGNGTISLGLYQVNAGEAAQAGEAGADLTDGETCTRIYARLAESRLDSILLYGDREPDVWAYLGTAHNQGLGAVQTTLSKYPMDWTAYKSRNPTHPEWARYGDSCIDGGERFGEVSGGTSPPFVASDLFGNLFGWGEEPEVTGQDAAFPVLPIVAAVAAAVWFGVLS